MLSRLKFEIDELVNEMLDRLPPEVFESKTTTFLDPSIAGGQFIRAICIRLTQAGHSWDNVSSRVHGLADSTLTLNYVTNKYKNKITGQFCVGGVSLLEEWRDMGKKFDVIVGNPPYQSEIGSQDRLWMQFLELSFSIVANNGYVAFVTPTSWTHNESLYNEFFNQKNPIHINIDECAKHFNGVGSTFSWFVTQNGKYDGNVTIQTKNDVLTLSSMPSRPFGSHPLSSSILTKMLHSSHDRLNAFSTSVHHSSKNYGKYSATKTETFNVPVVKSFSTDAVNYGWGKKSNVDESLNTPRVIGFSMVGGWTSGNGFKVLPDGCQTTQSIIHMPTENTTQASKLVDVLNSKLYQFAVISLNSNRTVRAQSLRSLPTVDLSRSWTDEELYNHFNLTNEEIQLIEDTIK